MICSTVPVTCMMRPTPRGRRSQMLKDRSRSPQRVRCGFRPLGRTEPSHMCVVAGAGKGSGKGGLPPPWAGNTPFLGLCGMRALVAGAGTKSSGKRGQKRSWYDDGNSWKEQGRRHW